MKFIILKLLCIVLYGLLLQIGAGYLVHNYIKGDYELSKPINYKLSLINQAPSPRIIVVGGSNTIFGIDCNRLAELTGYNVVNLGFNINIGLRYGLESLYPYQVKGDIILVSPEYENFFDERIYYGNDTVAFLAAKNVESLSSYYLSSWQQKSLILEKMPYIVFNNYYIQCLLRKSTVSTWSFNEFGDKLIENITFSGKNFNAKRAIAPQTVLNAIFVKDLLHYQKSAREKGARLIIAYPFIPEDTYKLNKAKLDDVHHKLQSVGLEIMAPPSESYAAKIYFDDHIYHPNAIGRIMRTDAIDYGLKKYIREKVNITPE